MSDEELYAISSDVDTIDEDAEWCDERDMECDHDDCTTCWEDTNPDLWEDED